MNGELDLMCSKPNKRPQITEEMRMQASVKMVARMVHAGLFQKHETDGFADDICAATKRERHDGYKIARELEERHHWECDFSIADSLEEFGGILDAIHRDAEKKWAEENPMTPLPEGSVVFWNGSLGTVHGVCPYRPHCYKFRNDETKGPESYFVVPFEDVVPT